MELLAPSGGMESVIAAVRTGADAVYIGAEKFSARAGAENFKPDELKNAVIYCHERNVKVYLAINTLIFDGEMREALEISKTAVMLGIDALIVQDIGLASLLKKHCPEIRLHASTQMTVHTPGAAKLLYKLGFSRVVLSRELSKDEIKEIVDSCPIETEIFVHGALCMCVSGQCYFSAFVGQRSGNRGRCAQPCRLPYKNKEKSGYPLSLKDLSLVNYIQEIKELGVTSVKIEGRMKRPEYVAEAVSVYKNAINNNEDFKDYQNLKKVFSRSGFTDGYYTNNTGKTMFGYRQKEDVLSADNSLFKEIHEKYSKEVQKFPINILLELKTGEKLKLIAEDGNYKTEAYGTACEKAIKSPLSKEKAYNSIVKTGGTPFYVKNFEFVSDGEATVSLSEINSLRRKAIDQLLLHRAQREIKPFSEIDLTINENKTANTVKHKKYILLNKTSTDKSLKEYQTFVPYNSDRTQIKAMLEAEIDTGVYLPRCAFGIEEKIDKALSELKQLGINDILIGNIYGIYLGKKHNMTIHGDFSLNITNSYALAEYKKLGLSDVILSPELTFNQISKIQKILPFSIVTYGKIPLMITRNCPNKSLSVSCEACKNKSKITDRTQRSFELKCFEHCTEIFNCVPIVVKNADFKKISSDFEYIRLSVENYDKIIDEYKSFDNYINSIGEKTNGLYLRGVN